MRVAGFVAPFARLARRRRRFLRTGNPSRRRPAWWHGGRRSVGTIAGWAGDGVHWNGGGCPAAGPGVGARAVAKRRPRRVVGGRRRGRRVRSGCRGAAYGQRTGSLHRGPRWGPRAAPLSTVRAATHRGDRGASRRPRGP